MPSGAVGDDDYIPLTALGKRVMTHEAEGPNPAQPVLDFASNFAGGGLQRALGFPNNFLGRTVQKPDNQAAMGMALGAARAPMFMKMLDEGKSVKEMANAFGLSEGTIRSYKTQLRPNEMRAMAANAKESAESLADILAARTSEP